MRRGARPTRWIVHATLTVAETAAIAEIPETTLRGWIARGLLRHLGTRGGDGKIFFSPSEAFAVSAVAALVARGVSPENAFDIAGRLAADGGPEDRLLVITGNDRITVSRRDDWDFSEPAIVLPLSAMWETAVQKAEALVAAT